MRAALWLIESGTCPDFKVKYVVSRLSDAEAALVNLTENIQREDPRPIQLAHAVRSLTEDYGLSLKQVAGRLKRSETWLEQPAEPRDAAGGDPGERGQRPDPGLGRPRTRQAAHRPAGRRLRRPGQRRREDHRHQGAGRSGRRSTRRPARAAPSPGRSSSSRRSWRARPAPPTPATSSPPTCSTTWRARCPRRTWPRSGIGRSSEQVMQRMTG